MTTEARPTIGAVLAAIEAAGLAPRGAFSLTPGERVGALAGVRTIALVGVAGGEGWDAFAAAPEAQDGEADPLDRFSRRVIGALAQSFGAVALYPFGGPPRSPFQQWAQRAEPVHPSPIGFLIHSTYGLWHSYRGALGFFDALSLPEADRRPSPCAACVARPCLAACPVGAFTQGGYDVPACARHLGAPDGADCMGRGCLARRACPVGAEYAYGAAQASFAMRAFLRARAALAG
ncbi:ferredoxin [Roseiarcus fermentans]|uniref:Ferredoxin n=1 Tax=Roseiarcus fermentans TaxID=1473586 RepID=A0A366EV83_9HYPH|nr:4Fe-4S dicluster domain-containing protein [Roseiarcus fermentans]RBP06244.1 ferredoxin [Roseiarcus fermentans]